MLGDEQSLTRLSQWMREAEGEHQEFKEAKDRYDFEKLVKYCCALANEGGGRVVLGVTDKRPRRVVGSKAFDQPERTRQGLCLRLPLKIDFEEIVHPDCPSGSRVLVFHVPRRPFGVPLQYEGRYWARKGDDLTEMPADKLREIFAESGHDFSADLCPGATLEDLDPEAVSDFRGRWATKLRLMEKSGDADRISAMPLPDLLTATDAIDGDQITYAGLVLFGTARGLTKHLAQAEVVFEYRSTDSPGPAQHRLEFRRGLFATYDQLWEEINRRNDRQDFRQGLFVTPIATFNERSVREAVLNAVSHRDYQMGGSIFIRQFPRRLEIDSPGGFPFGITEENILDRQKPRNRRIAEILTRCGLIERSGQRMNLIFEESIRQSKPLPRFDRTDQYQVGLTLHGTVQDPSFVRFVQKLGDRITVEFQTQDWLVLAAIAREEKVHKPLQGRARRLHDLGLIERVAGHRYVLSRKYYEFVGDTPAYTRKRGLNRPQNLQLLLNHITQNATTGCKLEDLCQVLSALPIDDVQLLLRSLQRAGRVHVVGRTKSAKWYPGPKPKGT